MNRPEILVAREKTHGNFHKNAEIWIKLQNTAYSSNFNPAQLLALNMIYLKLARMLSGNCMEEEHWKDIAGYAELGREACKEKS